jgi:hypothetical protein
MGLEAMYNDNLNCRLIHKILRGQNTKVAGRTDGRTYQSHRSFIREKIYDLSARTSQKYRSCPPINLYVSL